MKPSSLLLATVLTVAGACAASAQVKILHFAPDQIEDTYVGHDVVGGRENFNQGKLKEVRVGFQSSGQTFYYGLVGVKGLIGPSHVPPGARIVKATLCGSFYVDDYSAAKGKIFVGRCLTDWLSYVTPGDAGPEGTGGAVEADDKQNANYGPTFDAAFQYGGAWAGKAKDAEWRVPAGTPNDKRGFGTEDFTQDPEVPVQADSWNSADKGRFTADVTALVQAMAKEGKSCGFVFWAQDHGYAAFTSREFASQGGFELEVSFSLADGK
ncbi:MAG: hypothetical protein IT578_01710 [Verrucomicrobiae bacterium]|nr:hypothetical protein [Verrucomicrobiae bacterium]